MSLEDLCIAGAEVPQSYLSVGVRRRDQLSVRRKLAINDEIRRLEDAKGRVVQSPNRHAGSFPVVEHKSLSIGRKIEGQQLSLVWNGAHCVASCEVPDADGRVFTSAPQQGAVGGQTGVRNAEKIMVKHMPRYSAALYLGCQVSNRRPVLSSDGIRFQPSERRGGISIDRRAHLQ